MTWFIWLRSNRREWRSLASLIISRSQQNLNERKQKIFFFSSFSFSSDRWIPHCADVNQQKANFHYLTADCGIVSSGSSEFSSFESSTMASSCVDRMNCEAFGLICSILSPSRRFCSLSNNGTSILIMHELGVPVWFSWFVVSSFIRNSGDNRGLFGSIVVVSDEGRWLQFSSSSSSVFLWTLCENFGKLWKKKVGEKILKGKPFHRHRHPHHRQNQVTFFKCFLSIYALNEKLWSYSLWWLIRIFLRFLVMFYSGKTTSPRPTTTSPMRFAHHQRITMWTIDRSIDEAAVKHTHQRRERTRKIYRMSFTIR